MSFKSDSSFPAQSGEDDRPMFNGLGPEPWKCLDCGAAGKGYVKRAKHWYATGQGHHIVWGGDPRAKTAPKGTEPISLKEASCESSKA